MTSDPTWPVAPVIKIMSLVLCVRSFFGVGWGLAEFRRAGAAPRETGGSADFVWRL